MLSSIASKLWGTHELDVDSPDGRSTVASGDEDNAYPISMSELRCSVWELEGNDAKEIIPSAGVRLETDMLVLEMQSGEDAEAAEELRRTYKYCDMVHFHQQDEEIFQWLIKKGDSVEEFGIVFSNPSQACCFSKAIRPRLRESATVLCKEPVEFLQYEEKEWKVVENNACLSILQRKNDSESFLVLESTEGVVLSEVGVSVEEYIFPQPNEKQLCWWGPCQGCEANKQMYAARFDCGDMEKVFDVLSKVMKHHSGVDGEAEEYDGTSFVMESGSDEIKWLDAQEEMVPEKVVCKDTTRKIATEVPSKKVHRLMYVGSNRTFVVRGSLGGRTSGAPTSELQVLKFGEDGEQEVVATLPDSKLCYEERNLLPTKALLHDNESKLIIMDEGSNSHMYMMDVDREKVVQCWDAGMLVQNLIPPKGSIVSAEPTFLASNQNSVFCMDTRLDGKDKGAARTTTLSYSSNVQFTTGATDREGHVVMGSKLGDLRLYDGEANKEGKFKRAKTHLQGLGDPILHVTVTKDGSWLLGTCAKYLVLYPVKLASSGKSGFVTALGKCKPPPIVLKLNMEDMIKYKLTDVNFTKGEFNDDETAIVTSTGNLAIVWDFASAVKNRSEAGMCSNYIIRSVDDYIKDIDFVKAGPGESIVVATPCEVTTRVITAK